VFEKGMGRVSRMRFEILRGQHSYCNAHRRYSSQHVSLTRAHIMSADPAGGKNSVGNLRYRTILKAAVSQFKQEKSSNEKSIIAQHVLKDLEPGRMLQFQAHDGSFHHIGDEASLKKVHKDFYNVSANMMVLKRGNAAAGSGKKKKDGQGAKHKLCRSAPPRGVTKSAEEAPIRNEDSLAPNTIALTGGEDDASSGDPYSTKVEAELEATARRLETENSTLLRERIEALTAKNQKLRRLEKKNVNLLRERIEDLTAKNQKLRNEKYSRSPLSSLPENGV
jgi:hypothetical protein